MHAHTNKHNSLSKTCTQPTLDRKAIKTEDTPDEGEGSEFGKKRRDEVRKRKRGYELRKKNPDDQPWVLKEKKRGGKQYKSCLFRGGGGFPSLTAPTLF